MRCLLLGIFAGSIVCATGLGIAAEPEVPAQNTPASDQAAGQPAEQPISSADLAFFEEHVRPLLVRRCYECHSSDAEELKGGLALDTRTGWEIGGDSGAALTP